MRDGQLDVEKAVMDRYSAGARSPEGSLCCPVKYDPDLLAAIPEEILERDYGCGDPTPYVAKGDSVLDLGCGAGKICFLAAQLTGKEGRVIGLDMNEDMLALGRKHRKSFADRIGFDIVEFRKGRIQDLSVNLEKLEAYLREHPVGTLSDLTRLEEYRARLSREQPLIPDESIDCILSNCVLNLVRKSDRKMLFREMYRVLKAGGRVAISDIVADERIPETLAEDPELWSGCVSGAFLEEEFLEAFDEAGFYGMEMVSWGEQPFAVVEGIEFRSVTVTARKGKEGPCVDRRHAVIYKGPWRSVRDDDGHLLERGTRVAVCEKTFRIFSKSPYVKDLVLIPPRREAEAAPPQPFDCHTPHRRHPRETKGIAYRPTELPGSDGPGKPSTSCC